MPSSALSLSLREPLPKLLKLIKLGVQSPQTGDVESAPSIKGSLSLLTKLLHAPVAGAPGHRSPISAFLDECEAVLDLCCMSHQYWNSKPAFSSRIPSGSIVGTKLARH